jgi:hypothetical protein
VLRLLSAGGWDVTLDTDDRRVLEDVVFPYFLERPEFSRVLFVGCDWYTRRYNRVFAGKEYWTIDKNEKQRVYGAARHVVDSLRNLRRHFAASAFDVILCNGVVGWGLDREDEARESFAASFEALREQGHFVLGWNDVPRKTPFAVEACVEAAGFRPHLFPPLGTARHLTRTRNRHIFSFYAKRPSP